MGMFDYVNFKMKCPTCGETLDDFQSKDRDCLLEKLELYEVENFYTSCDNCNTWVEFTLKNKAKKLKELKNFLKRSRKKRDFLMEVRTAEEKINSG